MAIEQITQEAAPVISVSIAVLATSVFRWYTYRQHRVIREIRDNEMCLAPFPHECRGFLTVHHINPRGNGGSENPTNKITVCQEAQAMLHKGFVSGDYLEEMRQIAIIQTEVAKQNGLEFPF